MAAVLNILECCPTSMAGSAVTAKPLNIASNVQMCHDRNTWISDNWKHVMWSSELFPTSGRLYVENFQGIKPATRNA
jgi:hypothetical protein